MTKPYTEQNLSDLFDADLIWRRKELSDIKAAAKAADASARPALLRAVITMSYAHWEGYVRECANRYFEYLTLRNFSYEQLEQQIYVNTFLNRLDALHRGRQSLEARCKLVNDILNGGSGRFTHIHPTLIDTKSNLNTDVIKDICLICAVNPSHFEDRRTFIDVMVLKRRNAIAHGQQEYIGLEEIDGHITNILSLMSHFRTLLENKIYRKEYAA